jgi:DnaJ-class molecular chaperone
MTPAVRRAYAAAVAAAVAVGRGHFPERRVNVGTACPGCGGTGSIRYPPGPDWYAEQEDACWECEGTGRALDEEDSHDDD